MSSILEKADVASEVAREAFAAGDAVTGIAAIQLAAQLVQLARLLDVTEEARKADLLPTPKRAGK